MAQKILVTTDLSANSKAGIRFAIQLASQNGATLVFYTVNELLRPTRWSASKYKTFLEDELAYSTENLETFVATEMKLAGVVSMKYKCVSEAAGSIHNSVIDYAQKIRANFICLSTRGAGVVRKFLGTNASLLLTTSPVPVIVVPQSYRRAPVTSLLYASDFNNLGWELKKVADFALPLKAKVNVYHYDYLLHVKENMDRLKKIAAPYKRANVSFTFERQNIEDTLAYHLRRDVKKTKASMAVLFTKQNRGWFERIFLSSKSAELSFATTLPLLIFRKRQ